MCPNWPLGGGGIAPPIIGGGGGSCLIPPTCCCIGVPTGEPIIPGGIMPPPGLRTGCYGKTKGDIITDILNYNNGDSANN